MAGSSDLITQLTQGADADVSASADTKTWTRQRRPVCWRQPGELRVVQRPDAARSQRRRVRATSAVRVGYPESRAGHGREVEPGERGVLGFRRPEQGDNPVRPTPDWTTSPTRSGRATRLPPWVSPKPPARSTCIRLLC